MSGSILAITSGKGGVGKSTTALNLAVSLGADGASVVLVDADLGMANIGGMLDIHTGLTLHDVLAGLADVESTIVKQYEAIDVVPGGRNLEEYAEADPNRLPTVLATLNELYEYVVVDAGAGLGYADVVPIEAADEVILTTTPGSAAIGDTAKLVTFSERINAEVRGVVVTRVDEDTDVEVVATKVGTEPLGVVPDDPNVQQSIDAGLPLELYAPDSPAGVAYSRIADVISEGSEPYTGDVVQYPKEAEERDTGGVSDPLEEAGERDSDGVPDLLEEAGGRDADDVSDPLEEAGERDPDGVPDLLKEAEERDTGGAPESPEETAPITGKAEPPKKTSEPDGPSELPEDVTESAADGGSDSKTDGGLISRLLNLF